METGEGLHKTALGRSITECTNTSARRETGCGEEKKNTRNSPSPEKSVFLAFQ